jgi:hypothetical protein
MAVTGEQPTARVQHASARVGRQHDLPANPRDRGYEPYGREERVVDDQEEFVLVGEFGERWQIGDIHVRIGEPLDEERFRVGSDSGPNIVEVGTRAL